MKKFIKFLEMLEDNILMVLLYSMVTIVLVATFGRHTKLFTIPWSDEFARYAMVYMAFLGITIATRENRHFNVTALVDRFPPMVQRGFYVLRILLTMFFFGFIFYYAVKLCMRNMQMGQISPTLKLPMWIPYFSVAFGMGISLLWTIYNFIKDPLGIHEKENAKEDE